MRKIFTSAVLLGLALAVLAPAFTAASPAPECAMSCCRLGMMPRPAAASASFGMPGMPGCAGPAPCSMRGCGGAPPVAALAGLPPSVLPAVSALPSPAAAVLARESAFRVPASPSADLPEQPPRA